MADAARPPPPPAPPLPVQHQQQQQQQQQQQLQQPATPYGAGTTGGPVAVTTTHLPDDVDAALAEQALAKVRAAVDALEDDAWMYQAPRHASSS